VSLQLALLILWSLARRMQTHTSVPSAVLSFVNSLMILGLSYAEDRKTARPSTLLNIYLLFSSLFDATQVRTLWLTDRIHVAAVESASIGVKIMMLVLEAHPKRSYLKPPYKDYPPEEISGILNLSLVWWLNGLFVTGFRKLMTTQDLFDIDQSLRSDAVGEIIQKAWDKRGNEYVSLEDETPVILTVCSHA
jgi:ATP-binding cassette subfamily C (CFTR/MRP) protein 1